MMDTREMASSGAFVVMRPDFDGFAVSVSGPYLTLAVEIGPGEWEWIDSYAHSEGNGDESRKNGLYTITAAQVYDEAVELLEQYEAGSGRFAEDDEEATT